MRQAGITLTELLVAAVMALVLLAVAGRHFASESQVTRLVQTRQDAQDKVRTAAQLLRQDLLLVGSSRYVAGNTIKQLAGWTDCSVLACLTPAPGTVETLRDGARLRYITSLQPEASACREVEYRVIGGVLERGEAECGDALVFAELASGVQAAEIRYVCSTGVRRDDVDCGASAYPRSASVSLYVSSSMELSPDMTDPAFVTADGRSVACPPRRVCAGTVFEIVMPNLKDR